LATGSSPQRAGNDSDGAHALSDSDLLALLRREEQVAAGHQDSALAGQREQALAYYDREPFGIEEEGRSQVVTSEFADVIESIMPGLMRGKMGPRGQRIRPARTTASASSRRCSRTP
jgi:hypothetical protein